MSKPTNRDLQARLDNARSPLQRMLKDEWESDEFLRDAYREWLLHQLGDERPSHRWSWRNRTLLQIARYERSQEQSTGINTIRRDARTYEGWKGTRRRNNDGDVVLPARQVKQGDGAAFHIFMLGKRYGDESNEKTYKPMPRFLYDDTVIPITELQHLDVRDSELFGFYWPARLGFAETGPFDDLRTLSGIDSFGDLVYQRKEALAERLLACDDIKQSNVEEAISSLRNKFSQYAALFRTKNGSYRLQTVSDVVEADENLLSDVTSEPGAIRAGADRFVRAWEQPEFVFEPPEVKRLTDLFQSNPTKNLHDLAHSLSDEVTDGTVACGDSPKEEAASALTSYILSRAADRPLDRRDIVQGYAPFLQSRLNSNYEYYTQNDPTSSDWSEQGLSAVLKHSFVSASALYSQDSIQAVTMNQTRQQVTS